VEFEDSLKRRNQCWAGNSFDKVYTIPEIYATVGSKGWVN